MVFIYHHLNGISLTGLIFFFYENLNKIFKNCLLKETEMEIEDEVDLMMSTDIVTAQMSTKSITFSRAQSGWIFRQDKKVCTYFIIY